MAFDGSAEVSDSRTVTPKPPSVRLAGPDDEIRVFNFLKLLHQENGMGRLDPEKALGLIRRGTLHQGGLIGIIESDGRVVASVGLAMSQWWYSEDWHLEELWAYVHPDHRTDHHVEALLQFCKWASEQMGIPALLGILTLARAETKTRLYRRYLPQVGSLFLYVPPRRENA